MPAAKRYAISYYEGDMDGPFTLAEIKHSVATEMSDGTPASQIKVFELGPQVKIKVTPAKIEFVT